MAHLTEGNMRHAYAVLLVPAALLAGPSWAQDRAAVRIQPMVVKPQVPPRQAPPPLRQPPPRQPHELSHTVQQGPAPAPALTPLDRQVQTENRRHTAVSNVLKSRQDGEQNSIDNVR
jgi:hypothetical protein